MGGANEDEEEDNRGGVIRNSRAKAMEEVRAAMLTVGGKVGGMGAEMGTVES